MTSYLPVRFKQSVLVLSFMGVVGCASQHESPDPSLKMMRVCDERGCIDRPSGYSSLPANPVQSEDPKMTSLKQLAASDPRAAYDLALRYFRGDGVRQDTYQSIQWMRQAAEKGHLDAQKALGRLYLTGLGETGADYAEAQRWLSLTASRGDKEAVQLLKEANMARQSELDDYQWRMKWQNTFQNNWNSGYGYNWNWQQTSGWYLY